MVQVVEEDFKGNAVTPRPRGRTPAVAARLSAGADQAAVAGQPVTGWVQPAVLTHLFLPSYSKNCERLLQTPGAAGL